jgi:hypothetical protein
MVNAGRHPLDPRYGVWLSFVAKVLGRWVVLYSSAKVRRSELVVFPDILGPQPSGSCLLVMEIYPGKMPPSPTMPRRFQELRARLHIKPVSRHFWDGRGAAI